MDEDLNKMTREELIDEVKKAPHSPRTKKPYEKR